MSFSSNGLADAKRLHLFFYKRHEPEICQNFKNKIRECPGWDSVLEIFEEIISRILLK